jgi:hypothetical protein
MISLAQRAPPEQPLFLLADDRESQYTSRLARLPEQEWVRADGDLTTHDPVRGVGGGEGRLGQPERRGTSKVPARAANNTFTSSNRTYGT